VVSDDGWGLMAKGKPGTTTDDDKQVGRGSLVMGWDINFLQIDL
jgi:hypothetical protein